MPENNNRTLSKTKEWFEKAVPNPELKNFNAQLGTHIEEFCEMLECLNGMDMTTVSLIKTTLERANLLSWHLKHRSALHLVNIHQDMKLEFLDALGDQIVTAVGVAHMSGYDIVGAMNEVNDSNFSKFEDGQPLFDANRKIIKGRHYRKANLEPFLKK